MASELLKLTQLKTFSQMKKISSNNISNSVIRDFLSSTQWIELNSYNKKLDLSFFKKSEFDRERCSTILNS